MIDLVCFDLDDTLLRDDLSISDYTVKVLSRLAVNGVHIVPASGRAKKSMDVVLKKLECASACISCNGAEIWDGKTDRLIHRETFSIETGKRIAAFGKKHGCYSQTYENDCFYYSEESVWAERYAASSSLTGVYVGDLQEYIREERSKILMMDDECKIAEMLTEARSLFAGEASVTCSKPYFLEFNPVHATKGIALRETARYLGTSPENAIAFGDSLNDLSMLEAAGLSVAVGNAREDVLYECDAICGTNQEDGVARFLSRLFFEGDENC